MANRAIMRDRACAQCGTRPIAGYKFCSDACFQKNLYSRRAESEQFREYNRRKAREWKARKVALLPPISCRVCGSVIEWDRQAGRPPVFCSDECKKADRKARPAPPQNCKQCGHQFEPFRRGLEFCSPACQKAASRRRNDPIRRARKRNAQVEKFDPLEILERDGWRCHICKRATPKRLRGTTDPRAPEVDHIIPLAAGGEHSRKNTACACRRCNIKKSDKPLGQLRLIP